MLSILGHHVTLSDQGDGWFDGCGDVSGTIESVIQSKEDDSSYYVIRLESPLELQESGAATRSGFILRRYSRCVLHCRWPRVDINSDGPVSVDVLLIPPEEDSPKIVADVVGAKIVAWASCVAAAHSRTYMLIASQFADLGRDADRQAHC